jgi:hypothetical protein
MGDINNMHNIFLCHYRCKQYFGLAGVNPHPFLNLYLKMPEISFLNAYKLTQVNAQLQLSYRIINF